MIIDNFLERIIEDNDDIMDDIMFGTNNASNKEFLDLANDCAKNYCEYMKIPIDDFHSGKALFKTIEYFMNDSHRNEFCFGDLYGYDLEVANNFLKEILNVIEDEEKKGLDFDADIVCDSIINYMILLSSMRLENYDEVNENFEKVKQGKMKFEDIYMETSLSGFDHGEINIDFIIEICYIDEYIEEVKKEIDQIDIGLDHQRIIYDSMTSKKGKVFGVGLVAAVGVLCYVNPLLGMTTSGLLNLGTRKMIKKSDKRISRYYELQSIWYRYQYWKLILIACYNYYCKNYGGGINE